VQVGGRLDLGGRHVVRTEAPVGANHVKRRSLAARSDGQHACGGLHVVAPHEQLRVHAVALQQRKQHVPGRVAPDGARAPHLRAELGKHERGPARRARRRDADLLDQFAALALRDRLHGPDEHVEHVHPHAERPHLGGHPSLPTRWVVP
jgi:hypothetical protein